MNKFPMQKTNKNAQQTKSKEKFLKNETNTENCCNKKTSKKQPKIKQVCAVCLSQMDEQFVRLNCNHKFCTEECARGWWKLNQLCPYCRNYIQYIEFRNGQKIQKDELSQEESSDDQNFIPKCDQCWGDIEQGEGKKICKTCSSRFIHKNCLIFETRFWQCQTCANNVDSQGREVYPVIPYNEIIHYLASFRY